MRERERPAAPSSINVHLRGSEGLHANADLDVPQLADEVVTLITVTIAPSEEHVARRLHEPVPVHHPLAVVRERALACVRLQHRSAGLLNLEKEGIAVASHEQVYPAVGSDTADADHLEGYVADLVSVE